MQENHQSKKNIPLGDRLRNLREGHGLSQQELAEKLYLTRQTISGWERGRSQPDITSVQALAEIYEISIDELLHGVERVRMTPSKWRWLFFFAACALFIMTLLDGLTLFLTPRVASIGIIGGADGPTAIFSAFTSPSAPDYLIAVLLPLMNIAVCLFCIYWMLGQKSRRDYGFYRTIAAVLICLAALYILAQTVWVFAQGLARDFMAWLAVANSAFHPGFWAAAATGLYALRIYHKKRKTVQ